MASVLKMPVLGQSVEEVRLLAWLKNVGDAVAVGDNLAEIETDKVTTFFESPEAGFVRELLVPADSFVAVETPVLVLTATRDEPLASPAPLSPRARRAATAQNVPVDALAGMGTGIHGRVQEKDVFAYLEAQAPIPAPRTVPATPLARAVATDTGRDLSAVSGTGTGGRVLAADVRPAGELNREDAKDAKTGKSDSIYSSPVLASLASSRFNSPGEVRTVTLSGLRKRVADNIAKSVARAPHVTLHLSVDMSAANDLRQTLLAPIEAKTGVRLSPTDIVTKAVAAALGEHPSLNAHIEGDTITLFDDVHIGLAVSLGSDGLIVPVIHNAHRAGLAEIAARRGDITKRARAGSLAAADLTGATFTVSNLGNFGIENFNPIIAPPQVAILGVGTIADAVVARNGVPVVRPMMALSLSFDHRELDGAPAAAFLARIKEILETPTLLLV